MQPLVSIIIPVYNLEKYISTCLTSIEKIEYKNIECILINDGSTDNSLKIMESYKKNSKFVVKIVSQENQGVATARNNGLKEANGKYVFFFDGDDYVEPAVVSSCVKKATENDADIVFYGFFVENEETKKTVLRNPQKEHQYNSNELFSQNFHKIFKETSVNSLWNKMYNLSLLREHNICFSNQKMGEDALFNTSVYLYARRVLVLSVPLYHYITGRMGSAQSSFKKEYVSDEYNLFCSYYRLFYSWGLTKELTTILNSMKVDAQFRLLSNLNKITNGKRTKEKMDYFLYFKKKYKSQKLEKILFRLNKKRIVKYIVVETFSCVFSLF